jgi:hypothetical protein
MEKMEIRLAGGVVEFIFGPSNDLIFDDEGQPGLEIGYDEGSDKLTTFMTYNFPQLYERIIHGLKEKPIHKKFSVESVDEGDKIVSVCDPQVKNATLEEIVQWVWEKYYAHLEQATAVGSSV